MELSDLRVGDAVALESDQSMTRLCAVQDITSKAIHVDACRFCKATGKGLLKDSVTGVWRLPNYLEVNRSIFKDSVTGVWRLPNYLEVNRSISIPTQYQLETLKGYKGNSAATHAKVQNDRAIEAILSAVKTFLDPSRSDFDINCTTIKALCEAEAAETSEVNIYSRLAELEHENAQLKSKLAQIAQLATP